MTPCLTCTSATSCITCGFGEENRIGPPSCRCFDQYGDDGDSCITCVDPCKTCRGLDANDCLSCIDEYVWDPDTGICEPC